MDGRRDDVVRYVDPSADLTALAVSRVAPDQLAVRVSVRGVADPKRLRYRLLLRCDQNTDAVQTVTLHEAAPRSRDLTATVPVTSNTSCAWVAAETRYQAAANLPVRPVDRVGYRPVLLRDPVSSPSKPGTTNQKSTATR